MLGCNTAAAMEEHGAVGQARPRDRPGTPHPRQRAHPTGAVARGPAARAPSPGVGTSCEREVTEEEERRARETRGEASSCAPCGVAPGAEGVPMAAASAAPPLKELVRLEERDRSRPSVVRRVLCREGLRP